MKRKIIGLYIVMMSLLIGACSNPASNNTSETTLPTISASIITLRAIPGIHPPVMGETPVTTAIDTAQYTGTITWAGSPVSFAANTVYTANIVLTAKTGWTLTGVAANSFTVTGATSVTNAVNSGNVTAVFPATGATPVTALDGTALSKAYMAYYGAVSALASTTVTRDSATNEYVGQNTSGTAKVRYAMNLSGPLLITGAYTFVNYVDSTSGYTVNGTLSYVMTTDPTNVSSFYYTGSLTYTGGTVSRLSLDYSMSGANLSGIMTVGDIAYDIATYAVKSTPAVATPTFSVASGAYSAAQAVTLNCMTEGAKIFYTLDGSIPTNSSLKYEGIAIPITGSKAIRAIAVKDGMLSSVISMAGYVFSSSVTVVPVLTPSTIVFADGLSVTKMIGSGLYTNSVSGDGSGAITYTSGTPATASVDANTGVVTLISGGTTVITANKAATTTHSAVSNSYTLTVTKIPSTIVFSDGAMVSKQLGSRTYTNIITGGVGNGIITYSSGTEATATVNTSTGEVTLVSAGTTVITANKAATATHSAVSNSYTLTVTNTITNTVTTVSILNGTIIASPTSAAPGATITLIVKPSSGYRLRPSSLKFTPTGGIATDPTAGTDNTFSFLMPAQNVTVSGSFEVIPQTMILVPSGKFQRDATATNISEITKSYKISQTEITRAQFNAIMGTDPSGGADPVIQVNWYQAITYCNKLSISEGLTQVYSVTGVNFTTLTFRDIPTSNSNSTILATWNAATVNWNANGYRLPTEMEWMWAAMGATQDRSGGYTGSGTNTKGYLKAFAGSTGSNRIEDYAVFGYSTSESGRTTIGGANPVMSKASGANELGLFDMSGNVWEWCWDWYSDNGTGTNYAIAGTVTDYKGATLGTLRCVRGNSWYYSASYSAMASRGYSNPYSQTDDFGFRIVSP